MMIRELLESLNASDIKVWAEGEDLRCSTPKGALTPALQAELKSRKAELLAFLRAGEAVDSSLVPVQPKGSRPPFFGIPGHNGDVFCFVPLAQRLGDSQPFYGLQPPGFSGEREPFDSIPALAAHYARELKAFCPTGPYYLGGYCAGGTIAFELAQQLTGQGEKVALLVLFESPFPTVYRTSSKILISCRYLLDRIPFHAREFVKLDWRAKARRARDGIRALRNVLIGAQPAAGPSSPDQSPDFKARIAEATMKAVKAYRPAVYPGRVHIFMSSQESCRHDYSRALAWSKYAALGSQFYVGSGGCVGTEMLLEPFVETFEKYLRQCLDETHRNSEREGKSVLAGQS